MDKRAIHFPRGKLAQAVIAPAGADVDVDALVHTLDIPAPEAVLLIAGGAASMEKPVYTNLQRLFTEGLARAAATLDALIIDGGTHSGVMALIGQGVAEQARKPTLLGVSPAGKVTYPGKTADNSNEIEDTAPLDPNHTHFVLVATNEWGGETDIMYALAKSFSQGLPSVAVLVNGGEIAKNEALYNVRQKRPIIVMEGSGRLAGEIASIRRGKRSIPSDDPALTEIITQGDLHLFPITGPPQELEQLLLSLVRQQ